VQLQLLRAARRAGAVKDSLDTSAHEAFLAVHV
jgi:hypothetical protein